LCSCGWISYPPGNTGINVDLKEKESLKISSAIEEGVADIGIGADLEPLPSLERRLYAQDRLVCVTPLDHPLARKPRTAFEDILNHDLVSMQRASSNFLFLSNQARLAGKSMKVRVHVHNFSAALHMVGAGVGVAIVPASIAAAAAAQGQLSALPITDPWAERTLYLVLRRHRNRRAVRPGPAVCRHPVERPPGRGSARTRLESSHTARLIAGRPTSPHCERLPQLSRLTADGGRTSCCGSTQRPTRVTTNIVFA